VCSAHASFFPHAHKKYVSSLKKYFAHLFLSFLPNSLPILCSPYQFLVRPTTFFSSSNLNLKQATCSLPIYMYIPLLFIYILLPSEYTKLIVPKKFNKTMDSVKNFWSIHDYLLGTSILFMTSKKGYYKVIGNSEKDQRESCQVHTVY